jgi:hypothetical protein
VCCNLTPCRLLCAHSSIIGVVRAFSVLQYDTMQFVVCTPKYYSAWRHMQEEWSFQNFMSLDLTSKLIHNLCSDKLDRGLCGHTVYSFVGTLYITLACENVSLEKLDQSYTKDLH